MIEVSTPSRYWPVRIEVVINGLNITIRCDNQRELDEVKKAIADMTTTDLDTLKQRFERIT